MNEHMKLTSWDKAYREIAERLHAFQIDVTSKKEQNVANHLFNLLNDTAFSAKNKWFVRGIEKWANNTLDPIQLFASMSHSKSSERSRYENIRIVLDLLGSDARIDENTDFFSGCPTVMMSRPVVTRAPEFQTEIWTMFGSIMSNSINGLDPIVFEQYHRWYGVNIVSLSIFFFWIDSDAFVPLDSSTRSFLVGLKIWENVPYRHHEYVRFCASIPSTNIIRDIVEGAYKVAQGITDIHFKRETRDFLNLTEGKKIESVEKLQHAFKIIAIQPTQKGGHTKNLKKDTIYAFYDDYKFIEGKDELIHYTVNKSTRYLYQQNDIDIQLSAIVGKNGSGKSTLSELLFLAINTLSIKNKTIETKLIARSAHLNLYFFTDDLYKLSIEGNSATLNRYEYVLREDQEQFELNPTNIIDDFNFSSFFYTIGINYSLYGLNETFVGQWIHNLFHKNDGYQVPIVLNPYRDEGVINPNSEESLAKSRLLAHILDVDHFQTVEVNYIGDSNEAPNSRIRITEDQIPPELVLGKRPKSVTIRFDKGKFERLKKQYKDFVITNVIEKGLGLNVELTIDQIFEIIWRKVGTPEVRAKFFLDEVKTYIVYKIISIADTHKKKYRDLLAVKWKPKRIEIYGLAYEFFKEILSDTSHVTFKLWQAIHYLMFGHIHIVDGKSCTLEIMELATEINKIKIDYAAKMLDSEESGQRKFDVIHFIPPSIFNVDILFENGHKFADLSSGEKQSIFAINTVAYHLSNLDSINVASDLISYPSVNVLFDEVELYFHPDMQRRFIHDLLSFIDGLNLENIKNIHIQFITHSPFVLSDIPSSNVLRIEDGNDTQMDQETFGGNVHDLLHHDFFMKHFMGEFARNTLSNLIDHLSPNSSESSDIWSQEKVEGLIQIIGDEYLKNDVTELYNKSHYFDQERTVETIEREMALLQRELENLQKSKEDDSNS